MLRYLSPLFVLAFAPTLAHADQAPISIDGLFQDWAGAPPLWQDASGDAGGGGADFLELRAADDDRFLFLYLQSVDDLDLGENNALRIYLDTDANEATGLSIGGIGAELEWVAGERIGTFYFGGDSTTVFQDHIRFRSGPTVTSSIFEIAIGRDTLPDGVNPLFLGSQVRILFVDDDSGDDMPDAGNIVTYTLDVGKAPPTSTRTFDRPAGDTLRMVTHNVLNSGPFDPGRAAAFERLYTAVDADIFHFQELSNHSGAQTANLITNWLGGEWHHASVSDCKTVSRYPVLDSWAIDNNLAALIDTSAVIGTPMLCINAHLPCCDNDSNRQAESDAIIAFIREAHEPGGVLTIGPDVPVVIVGDLNLVGLAQQLETLLTGDIQNEGAHGPDHAPDPDGSDLTSLISRQTEKRMAYTWRNDGSSFWPGHLDFMIYSDSNFTPLHDFIVYTPEMSATELAANDLLAGDSNASDHLVFCADFVRPPACAEDLTGDGDVNAADLAALLGAWGPVNDCPPSVVGDADLNDDCIIDAADLAIMLGAWGPCL